MIIGGYHGRIDEKMGISSDVWYFMDPLKHNYEATLLNSLNEPRMEHSCGIMRKNKNEDKFIAVVAGGYNGFKSLDSVEILEFDKGSLISEIFSFCVKSPQKRCQITLLSTIHLKRRCSGEWHLFSGDFRQTEKKNEIKLPVVIQKKK